MTTGILIPLLAAVTLPVVAVAEISHNKSYNDRTILLEGETVSNSIELAENESIMDSLRARNGHSTIEGGVQLAGNLVRVRVEQQASLTFEGAIQGEAYLVLNPIAQESVITFKGQYVNGANRFTDQEGPGVVVVSSPENRVGEYRLRQGTLRTDAAHAFDPVTTVIRLGGDNEYNSATEAIFDLNGNDQEIAALAEADSPRNSRTVTSSDPALLTISGWQKGSSFSGQLSGNLSLLKKGGESFLLKGEHSHTGSTKVQEGVLELEQAMLTHTSRVEIMRDGILKGSGLLKGDTVVEGTLEPLSQLRSGNLSFMRDSVLIWTNGIGENDPALKIEGRLQLHAPVHLRLAFEQGTHRWDDSKWSQPGRWIIARTEKGISGAPGIKLSAEQWKDSAGRTLKSVHPRAGFQIRHTGNDLELTYHP